MRSWRLGKATKVCLFLSFLWHLHSITFTRTFILSSFLHHCYIISYFIDDAICTLMLHHYCVIGCGPVVYIQAVQVASSLLRPLVYLVLILQYTVFITLIWWPVQCREVTLFPLSFLLFSLFLYFFHGLSTYRLLHDYLQLHRHFLSSFYLFYPSPSTMFYDVPFLSASFPHDSWLT